MGALAKAVIAAFLVGQASCSVPPLKAYAYPAWGFAVSFRAAPTETLSPARTAGGPHGGFKGESALAGRDFLVSVADGSASTMTDDQIMSGFPQALAQGGKLTSQTYFASGPIVGREVLIDKPSEETQRARIFLFHRLLYEVSAKSSLGPRDAEVTAFLDSFHLLGG
jgi:hypothetical protein